MPMPRTRPTVKRLMMKIEERCSIDTACEALKICRKTLYNYADKYEEGTLPPERLKLISETLYINFPELENYKTNFLNEKIMALMGDLFHAATHDADSLAMIKGLAVKYEIFELAMIVKQFELPQQG